jgi:hypothetical protein
MGPTRLRKLKEASEALKAGELSQGGVPATQDLGQENSSLGEDLSASDEAKDREVSDPVKLAACSLCVADFLKTMEGLVPKIVS